MAPGTVVSLSNASESRLDDPRLLGEWFAVAWSREIKPEQPVSRRVLGRDVVLWRSSDGIHCWLDLCMHRGARLSLGQVRGDCLVCRYHAWEYNASGQCVRIPAHPQQKPPLKARAQTYHVRERYGMVWVCLGEPLGDVPEFAYGADAEFRLVLAGPYRFRALGPRVIENLFDVAHLGFVHAGLLGDPEHGEIEDYEVEMGRNGPEAKKVRIWQPDPDGTGKAALVTYHYWASGPLTAGLVKVHGEQRFAILAQVAPVDAETCDSRLVIALNYAQNIPDEELLRFQDEVTAQDKVVVESQRPELLPLDLQAELHLRSDRMAVAYRKWLREIGFTYGTA
jgi:phenylpropionate dioxygenase-like ring-hydroxylating dioxygenase large terminal subunit